MIFEVKLSFIQKYMNSFLQFAFLINTTILEVSLWKIMLSTNHLRKFLQIILFDVGFGISVSDVEEEQWDE